MGSDVVFYQIAVYVRVWVKQRPPGDEWEQWEYGSMITIGPESVDDPFIWDMIQQHGEGEIGAALSKYHFDQEVKPFVLEWQCMPVTEALLEQTKRDYPEYFEEQE